MAQPPPHDAGLMAALPAAVIIIVLMVFIVYLVVDGIAGVIWH